MALGGRKALGPSPQQACNMGLKTVENSRGGVGLSRRRSRVRAYAPGKINGINSLAIGPPAGFDVLR